MFRVSGRERDVVGWYNWKWSIGSRLENPFTTVYRLVPSRGVEKACSLWPTE
jgi:hypothetical protein